MIRVDASKEACVFPETIFKDLCYEIIAVAIQISCTA